MKTPISKNKIKLIAIIVLAVVALSMVTVGALGYFSPVSAATTTDKTCEFVTMGSMSQALCSDGSSYNVELIAGPLP